ncbi:hypothetical protein CPLU01_13589 [Colletotrichum plurivorum]|uniref:Uncharacterized protein n=1 Tax=Colletotrichum plurivorum TaxID=2175906 RepID=A0A8H6JRK6_9PEZI|nr:hypothetical protein CPLU01_13589 [Colletotrichum plurivorum]
MSYTQYLSVFARRTEVTSAHLPISAGALEDAPHLNQSPSFAAPVRSQNKLTDDHRTPLTPTHRRPPGQRFPTASRAQHATHSPQKLDALCEALIPCLDITLALSEVRLSRAVLRFCSLDGAFISPIPASGRRPASRCTLTVSTISGDDAIVCAKDPVGPPSCRKPWTGEPPKYPSQFRFT